MHDAFTYLIALNGDIGFMGGAFILDIPLIRDVVVASEGLFVPRGGDAKKKQEFVD